MPDIRDFRLALNSENPTVSRLVTQLYATLTTSLPSIVDLRQWCPPIVDQGNLGSCTANAAAGLYGYYEKIANGKLFIPSRLFTYKTTRNLMGETGDSGAYLRDTIKSMAAFGSPPESYYGYDISVFDEEPSTFHYALAQNYQAVKYVRIDSAPGASKVSLLQSIKAALYKKQAIMFGFTVYESYTQADNDGCFPFPGPKEQVIGGHAMMITGYDDLKVIGSTTGAFCIRNSWGDSWGESGYGWLPYAYVMAGIADDFWTLTKTEWLDLEVFN